MTNKYSFIQNYMEKMKFVHQNLLGYLANSEASNSDCEDFIKAIKKQQILESKNDFKALLYLISNISNNHYRSSSTISKIENILKIIKSEIQKEFNAIEIFSIFKSNKRILLFLLDERIIQLNDYIRKILKSFYFKKRSYNEYLFKNSDTDSQLKQIGENESHISNLIRNDSIEEFISYVNQNSIDLTSTINPSIYETNPLLINKNVSLIEYASFYGSIQIFKYLQNKNVKLTQYLWPYVIHSNNAELFHLLEENIEPLNSYVKCYKEAVKSHHNEFAEYIYENLLKEEEKNQFLFHYNLRFYNFIEICNCSDYSEKINNSKYLVKYDYINIQKYLLEKEKFDLNDKERGKLISRAVINGNTEMVKLLIKDIDFEIISMNLYDELFLFSSKYSTDYYIYENPLNMAIEQNNCEMVKILLTNKCLKNEQLLNEAHTLKKHAVVLNRSVKKPALYMAIEEGNIEIIKLLLVNKKIDINEKMEIETDEYSYYFEKIKIQLYIKR